MQGLSKPVGPYDYPILPTMSKVTGMAGMPLSWEYLLEYARMKYEQGADKEKIQELVDEVVLAISDASKKLEELPDSEELAGKEPDDLPGIRSLRPAGPRRLACSLDQEQYRSRIAGAVCGRFAGCTLGAPVEFWSVEDMRDWAAYCGQAFPPTQYWRKTKTPNALRYEISTFEEYELDKIDKVPVDDDVTYTILCLLVMERYGLAFTTAQAGRVWTQCLPRACTAEEVVLNHLKNGMPAEGAAVKDNPYRQWIGADIRADAWGYVMPGRPEEAAQLAYRDACLTHRRNGIYGEMYFSAVIAAAFAAGASCGATGSQERIAADTSGAKALSESGIGCMEDVLKLGLTEIPAECLLARDIRWALETAPGIADYAAARRAVEEYFGGMSGVHTNLNACLTIFGLLLGKEDFTKVIGEITAMGYDNDCNAATAGSIFGAFYGIEAIPEKWYTCFAGKVTTYLDGYLYLDIEDICNRFYALAREGASVG